MNDTSSPDYPRAGLIRRLLAAVYDLLLIAAIWLIAGFIALPLSGGEAIAPDNTLGHALYSMYLYSVTFAFFGWFWTRGGQTLGMRAWRLRVEQPDHSTMTWRQALIRFLVAILSWGACGLGVLWILVDKDKRTWHDRASGTRVVVLPKVI
ncbi:MAG: RDD family protein [Granulosicoccaceae bacterium]|jgi:uncharacterized RDD family membrane protein YckC